MISTSHLHPMLVHFPIALILIGFLMDFAAFYYKKEVGLSMIGFYLLLIGTVSAIFALLSGMLFTSEMESAAGKIKETHEMFAWITVINLVLLSAYRIYLMSKGREFNNKNGITLAWYGMAAIAVSITGYFGGSLVYNYMMAI